MKKFNSETAKLAASKRNTKNNPGSISKSDIWKSIRSHCLECKGSFVEVSGCDGNDWVGYCPLHPFRLGKRDVTRDDATGKKNLRQAIRLMCNQCMSGNLKCESNVCGLRWIRWPRKHTEVD